MHRTEREIVTYRHVVIMIVLAFCLAGLVGCFEVGPFPSNPIAQNKSGDITSGRMESGAVRNMLGDPRITSRYWGVEVFREAASKTKVQVALLMPIPIVSNIYQYTLVTYDKDRVAESVATGTYRRGGSDLFLDTRDFLFVVRDLFEILFVKLARRDVYLQLARSSSQCTAVVGCDLDGNSCSRDLTVDNGPSLPIPCIPSYSRRIAALSLVPGEHTLKASGVYLEENPNGTFSGEQSINFSCRPGEVLYVVIHASVKKLGGWTWSPKGELRIDLHKDMPEFFIDRDLVIYRGDRWVLNPEPEN